jgi:hypothetical protein
MAFAKVDFPDPVTPEIRILFGGTEGVYLAEKRAAWVNL